MMHVVSKLFTDALARYSVSICVSHIFIVPLFSFFLNFSALSVQY